MKLGFSAFSVSRVNAPTLIEAARYGDHVAYEELINRTYKPLRQYCASMGDPFVADDLVQETFSRALKNTKSWVEATSVEAFMIHIAKCVCADYIRSVEKDRKVTTLARINRQDHQDVDYTVLDITHCLSSDQREAFLLTQFLGFSYEECAAIMGTAVGTVRSRVSRARAQLQVIVQEA